MTNSSPRGDLGSRRKHLEALRGKRVAVVASTGGHLEQAVRWANRLDFADSSLFVTFDSEQSQGLLRNRRREFIPYVEPRDALGAIHAIPKLNALLKEGPYDAVLSTGAGVAVSAYAAAVRKRLPFIYVESVSRFLGPSLTGRLLARMPNAATFTQHASYASNRWQPVDNLLTDYEVRHAAPLNEGPRRIFVTLGTIRPYRFDSLVDAVLRSLRPEDIVLWQLGETERQDLPGKVHKTVSASEFDNLAQWADIVVTHSGVGSVLRLLDLGVSPIVVPRSSARHEHVDDHQVQVADALSALGLVRKLLVEEFDTEALHAPRPRITLATAEDTEENRP